jgi:iron complex transport system substrate-binding protein
VTRLLHLGFAVVLAVALASAVDAPHRIISASPSITEILYGVGAFDEVVAVTEYDTYPPAVKSLPHIGKWENTDLEKIAILRPDLVLFIQAQAPFIEPPLRQLGIQYLPVPSRSLDDVFTAMDLIGKATHHETGASELAARVHAKLDAVQARTRGLPRQRVLLIVDRTPGTLRDLYSATRGSFLCDLVEVAGGECVGAPERTGYGKISKEAVVALAPDIVIDFVHGSNTRLGEDPQTVWRDLPELRAVRDGRVYPVREEFAPHPSQFVADTAEVFLRIIHPETNAGKSAR